MHADERVNPYVAPEATLYVHQVLVVIHYNIALISVGYVSLCMCVKYRKWRCLGGGGEAATSELCPMENIVPPPL